MGGFAEYVAVSATALVLKPAGVSFEMAAAKRGSFAAAQSAVLPRRECPQPTMRPGSTSGMVSSASSPRESPQAHMAIVAGSSFF